MQDRTKDFKIYVSKDNVVDKSCTSACMDSIHFNNSQKTKYFLQMKALTNEQTDERWTNRRIDIHSDGRENEWIDGRRDRHSDERMNIWTDGQRDRQRDRRMNKQTDRRKDRHTDGRDNEWNDIRTKKQTKQADWCINEQTDEETYIQKSGLII